MSFKTAKQRRINRVRSKVQGTADSPRLSVYRSNKYIYAQVIRDDVGETLVAVSDFDLKKDSGVKKKQKTEDRKQKTDKQVSKIEKAGKIGELVANRAKKKKVSQVKFDRGAYAYHGRVKALAEGARKGGLVF